MSSERLQVDDHGAIEDSPPQRTATRRSFGRWAPVAAIGTPTALVGLHALVYGRWIVDDAAITFAYARSIANGLGPVLQPDTPPAEGYSNPAWLALLTTGHRLNLFDHGSWFGIPDYVAFPKLLALVACACLFAAFYKTAKVLTRWPVAVTIVAGAITAAIPSFVIWCFSGLENSLLAATVGWLAALIATSVVNGSLLSTRTAVICGLLATLAALTRPDGMIYLLAYPLAAVLLATAPRSEKLRCAFVGLTSFGIPFAVFLGWRFATFGEFVPNTALAKSQGLPGLMGLARPLELAVFSGVAPALLGTVLVVLALRKKSANSRGLLALLLVMGLAAAAFAILEGDWMGQRRFATPIWAMGALIIAVAGALVLADATPVLRRKVLVASGITAAIALPVFAHSALNFRADPTVPACAVATYSGWTLNGYAKALGLTNAAVATPDVGGAALVSDLRVIDLGGLTDAGLAKRWSTGDVAGLRDDVFGAGPEFIETHHEWSDTTGIVDDPRLATNYVELARTDRTDGLWLRKDLAGKLPVNGSLPISPKSLPLNADDPYQLAEPLASCELKP